MNTEQSDKIVSDFMNRTNKCTRWTSISTDVLPFAPKEIFPLLCPTTEHDWIDWWKAKLIYTNSGYAEYDCIFETTSPRGEKEIWVCNRYELNREIDYIRTADHLCLRLNIRLIENDDKTTTIQWKAVHTALDEKGNEYIEEIKQTAESENENFGLIKKYLSKSE